jgi:hypothetical protein
MGDTDVPEVPYGNDMSSDDLRAEKVQTSKVQGAESELESESESVCVNV